MPKRSVASHNECYEYMFALIMSKELMPEDKIPEAKIAETLKISRTPVRDAMRRLSNEGLIEIFPNRFAQVKHYTLDEIRDIGTVRIALDSMAVKLAIIYGNQMDFMNLKNLAQQCFDASQANDLEERRIADCDFHQALANISGNQLLIKYQTELYKRVQFIMLHHPNPVQNEKMHLQQHFDLVEALTGRDEASALLLIRQHLSSFYDLQSQFPENFFTTPFID